MSPPSPSSPSPALRPVVGDLLLALVLGVAAYALSCLLVAPEAAAKGFGTQWQLMSEAPFELRGQLPQRLLAPLLAHGLGCGGDGYVWFVRGLAVLLLATIGYYCRRRGAPLVDAALVVIAVAVTAPVQMYKEHWVGYPDALTYTLCLWLLLAARRPQLFWLLFFANLLNHELAVFLLPWLWFVRRRAGGSWRADVVGAGAALALYAAFYFWVRATAQQQAYSYDYFAKYPLFPGGTLVVSLMALTHFVVAFGPVLVVVAWHQHTSRHGRERWHLWLVLAGMGAIFCIAFDWARHGNLLLLPLVIASVPILAAGHRAVYAGLVALGIGLMLWIPPWAASAWPIDAMANLPFWVETGVVQVFPEGGYGSGSLPTVVRNWLPRVAPMLAAIAAIGTAIWLGGLALARRRNSNTDTA
jgi:hypothetical protein